MIGELGAGLPEAQTQIDRDGILIAVLGSEAERRIAIGVVVERGLDQPPAMALAAMGWCDGDKIDDRGAGHDPAEKKAHRRPALADHEAPVGPAGEAAADPGFLLPVRDLIGNEGIGVEAVQGESATSDGGAGGKVGGRRQMNFRYGNSPSGEIAGHGDQAFDPPEARGFQGEGTVRVSRGNATGAERDIPAGPVPDEVRAPRQGPCRRPRIFRR